MSMIEKQTHDRTPTASERIRVRRYAREGQIEEPRTLVTPFRVGITAVIAALSGAGYEHATAPKSHNVPAIVQPFEAPWTIATRAEAKYGNHPEDFDIREEADRLAKEYGPTLTPGEKVEVHVK